MNGKKQIRCTIYARNATAEGVTTGENSLRIQKEEALNYIKQRKNDGWVCVEGEYHDIASGLTMERPALKRLMEDIIQQKIDCVVLFHIDRLTRHGDHFVDLQNFFKEHDVILVTVMPPADESLLIIEHIHAEVARRPHLFRGSLPDDSANQTGQ